ncbi:MAG: hypothetical protein Kow0031_29540 [Anaerolineae bacterium]
MGQSLGGYQLIEAIGSGAMATVYKAFQPTLERWVAVKVLHYRESQSLARFRREARAIALLRHRNILMVYEYGEERDWPFIVMEYVPGGALNDLLSQNSGEWQRRAQLLIPVADALRYAHEQGVIHRDVKPSNILLPQPDWPLLADFGLAKLSGGGEQLHEPVTRSGTSLGTPAYVAPEQARGIAADQRSDMYSLGVILYETVTGRLPFLYSNPNKMLLAHISEPVQPPSHLNPACPPPLERVILKTLDKVPGNRYKDMGQFIEALQEALTAAPLGSVLGTVVIAPPGSNPLETTHFEDPVAPPAAAPPAAPRARILITERNATVNVPPRPEVILGRTHRQTVADVDLGPHGAAEMGVSRHHARLIQRDGRWLLDDLGSLNGTFVNDTRVQPGQPVPLNNGDFIRCSHLAMVFLIVG